MKELIAIILVSLTTCTYGVPVLQPRTHGNFVPELPNSFKIFNPSPVHLEASASVSTADAVAVAINFFASNAKVPTESITVSSSHTASHNGVTHVYLQQVINGLEVSNGVGNVNVNKNGQVISIGKSFYTGPVPPKEENSFQPKLSAKDAVEAFGKFLNVPNIAEMAQAESLSSSTGYSQFSVSGAAFAVKEIPAVMKYIQVNGGSQLALVWSLEVETEENMYNAFVDVNDGEIIALIDWVSDASYNVYPFGINDPDSGDRSILQDPAHPVASPAGWHSQGNGKVFTTTLGNNVYAQENHNGNSAYLNNYRPDGGSQLNFNFPINLAQQPQDYVDAAVTNLFYWNNIIHDLFYVYGFNEEAGNFQEENFGRGGAQLDAVIAQAQDGSGFNNANFFTPPDGRNGRMRMYVWTNNNPKRDGDLDGGIIMHEYAHGISKRLTGGRNNVECLPNGEAGGMGEGWGDAFATITRVTANTTKNQNYAMGDYSAGDPAGIRKYLYSTDLTINPSTYSYVSRPEYQFVHAKGEVWAVILYEVFWNLVEKNGFDPNWFNASSSGGNVKMLQLIIDGMKLQPCNPNFVQARDAILQADQANNGGENKCALWQGFAKRGLGTQARFEGVESFDLPAECS